MAIWENANSISHLTQAYLFPSKEELVAYKNHVEEFNYMATIMWLNEPTSFPCFAKFEYEDEDDLAEEYVLKFVWWKLASKVEE